MNPPDNIVVIFGDGETRIQALDGTQPVFPLNEKVPKRLTTICFREREPFY